MVFDGNGNITDMSGFGGGIGGNYSVTTGGAFSGNLIVDLDTYPFTGQLSSLNDGTSTMDGTGWIMSRVTNPGALTDTLVGTLSTQNCGQNNVTIKLNSQGDIISATGLVATVTGRIYEHKGVFMGHFKTGGVSGWNEISIMGYFANDSLKGRVGLDNSGCGNTDVKLKRKGVVTPTGMVSIAASVPGLIVYPNPASDIITLNVNNTNNAELTLNIYNVIGKLIHSEILQQNQQTINTSDLNSGIYLVEIKSDEWSGKQRLVIQR
jgi:hypothetical protein